MANVQLIRRRIRSVRNIKQITKAMEMVAASKLRRSQEATLRLRAYAVNAREALARLRTMSSEESHALLHERPVERRLLIIFTSDRGLAGAYNSNIFRKLLSHLQDTPLPTQAMVVGHKGANFLASVTGDIEVIGAYTNWPANPVSRDVRPLAATAIDSFIDHRVDSVELLYTDYISAVRQAPIIQKILPIDSATILAENGVHIGTLAEAKFEPSPTAVLEYILPRLIETQIYRASLEATASEHAMRMLAMKNASDNATDIIGDLTQTYNGARQSAITQELAEISAGTEASKV